MPSIFRENGMFVQTFDNQVRWQKVNSDLTLKVGMLWNILQFSLTGGFSHSISEGHDYTHNYTNWHYRASALAMYKKWMLVFEMFSNHNDLRGETVRGGENMHALMGMYRQKNISVSVGMMNPFADNFKTETENRNQYASRKQTMYANETSRMLLLKFSWNFQFGRKFNAGQKRFNNKDEDAGIMNVGK